MHAGMERKGDAKKNKYTKKKKKKTKKEAFRSLTRTRKKLGYST